MTKFAKRFSELRNAKHMSQEDLAKALGLSASTVSKYESGQRVPPIYRLAKIARFFNVTHAYLIGETDEKGYYDPDAISDPDDRKIVEASLNDGVGSLDDGLSEAERAMKSALENAGIAYGATMTGTRFILSRNGFGCQLTVSEAEDLMARLGSAINVTVETYLADRRRNQ